MTTALRKQETSFVNSYLVFLWKLGCSWWWMFELWSALWHLVVSEEEAALSLVRLCSEDWCDAFLLLLRVLGATSHGMRSETIFRSHGLSRTDGQAHSENNTQRGESCPFTACLLYCDHRKSIIYTQGYMPSQYRTQQFIRCFNFLLCRENHTVTLSTRLRH